MPLRVNRTFTYRLPLALQEDARLGSRLLVPFGRKRITGYVVALLNALDPATELTDADIKDAEELLDAEPLVTPDVLEITRWVADYYAAPWGEVLKAALPAGLNATVEQILSITTEGRDELARLPHARTATAKALTLKILADAGEIHPPVFLKIFLSSSWAIGPFPSEEALDLHLRQLPADLDVAWVLVPYSMNDPALVERLSRAALDRGGGIRVGIGDNAAAYPGTTNAALVEQAAKWADAAGRAVATPADTRRRLDITT